jgi:RimJ/RimL family protein N-acetyltransferase
MRRILKRVRQEDMIPLLETERLRFRAWNAADFEPFAAIYADEAHARYIGGACERDEAWRRLAGVIGHWTLRGYGLWALEAKRDGSFVGWAGLWNPEGWPEPEVGWTLVPAAHGLGLATEAALRARAYAYDNLGWTTAVSLISLPNQASVAVAERLGARMERTMMFREIETGIFRHPDKTGNLTFRRQFQ